MNNSELTAGFYGPQTTAADATDDAGRVPALPSLGEATRGRCHVIETTTRSGIACVRNFKRPRRPRATWSSLRRGARGAIELI